MATQSKIPERNTSMLKKKKTKKREVESLPRKPNDLHSSRLILS